MLFDPAASHQLETATESTFHNKAHRRWDHNPEPHNLYIKYYQGNHEGRDRGYNKVNT
jgi:hypothetical protein